MDQVIMKTKANSFDLDGSQFEIVAASVYLDRDAVDGLVHVNKLKLVSNHPRGKVYLKSLLFMTELSSKATVETNDLDLAMKVLRADATVCSLSFSFDKGNPRKKVFSQVDFLVFYKAKEANRLKVVDYVTSSTANKHHVCHSCQRSAFKLPGGKSASKAEFTTVAERPF